MPVTSTDPVLQSVLRAAQEATGAARALLLAIDGDDLLVVAAAGEGTSHAPGVRVEAGSGVAGFVAMSGQPVALRPSSTDERLSDDVAVALGLEPDAVLTVPCTGNEEVTGVLELLDAAGEGGFDFDHVEMATTLAGIAGVALEAAAEGTSTPTPAELGGELTRLAETDPGRYATVARLTRALLDHG